MWESLTDRWSLKPWEHKTVQQVNVGGEKQRAETEDGVLGYTDTLVFRGQVEKQADSLSRRVRKGARRMQRC